MHVYVYLCMCVCVYLLCACACVYVCVQASCANKAVVGQQLSQVQSWPQKLSLLSHQGAELDNGAMEEVGKDIRGSWIGNWH